MSLPGLLFACVTVLAWGSWLAPSQKVPLRGQQTRTFYVTIAVLLLALIAYFAHGAEPFTLRQFALPFAGGLIWALSCWSAFVGASRLGMARAFGIWAPLNILVSIGWGMLLFGEFIHSDSRQLLFGGVAIALLIAGILMIVLGGQPDAADEAGAAGHSVSGYLGALGAGIGFASYFIPVSVSHLSLWTAMVPLACGMVAGGTALALISRSPLRLEHPGHYWRLLATGALWGIGNYSALAMMERIGTGKGFTIAQLCVVVNALIGIYFFGSPKAGSRQARWTLAGVAVAAVGGIVFGGVKS
ncbi:MAG: GRP family sugar transporter [Lacunisphaera sp.]